MADASITLPIAIALAGGSSLLTVGMAWGLMRGKMTAHQASTAESFRLVEKKQDTIDRDIREGFNRIAALERGAVTYDALREFRSEIITEIHGLRELIEKIRSPRRATD